MKNSNGWLRLGALAAGIALLAAAPVAFAAGFSIFEAGSKATGMAGAYIASADDGSSMFYNPAGLATNDKFTVSLGVTLIAPFSSFEGANPYPGQGYSADQKKQIFFPPNFYVSVPVAKKVNVSLGTWFPNGLSTAWENPDTFRGRFLAQRVDLRQYSMALQVSAALTDWLSIGAGPELRISDVKLQQNAGIINPYTASMVDVAHVNLVGDGFATDLAWGAGIQIKPTCNFTIGAAYHSQVDQSYKGNAVFYQISTGHADLDAGVAAKLPVNQDVPAQTTLQYPALTLLGVAFHNEKLTVEAAATYTQWKVFDQTVFTFSPAGRPAFSETIPHNWVNAWSYRLGMNYQATPKFNVALGVVYDQTPQPDQDVSPLLPDANRTGYTFGVGLKVGKSTVLEFSNMFLFFHDRNTNGRQVANYNGVYKTFADLAVLNLRTSF